ncbi:MAG: GTP cyclohydrolase I FolE, partial [Flavobacteriales bacterium]|nr:GTP cyclohydrolase I FolE [Flavobacteriales bacterium]
MSDNYNKNLANNIKSVLSEIGENTERDGLLKTPERVAKSMEFLTNGYDKDPSEILKSA